MSSNTRFSPKPAAPESAAPDSRQRLQKVLAAAGYGSRRSCEDLILAGRVAVDGEVVSEMGVKVDPRRQEICVDGDRVRSPKTVYYAINKPSGVVSTHRDPSGRMRVIDLVDSKERLFTVGRLDKSSEGLILVTNDGELANRLTHPRYGIEKTYVVEAAGKIEPNEFSKLRTGVHLAEGLARVERIRVKNVRSASTTLEIVLKEGKNREIRRILAAVGHKVMRLKRVAIGPLRIGELPQGAHRALTGEEIEKLQQAVLGGAVRKGRAAKKSAKRPSPNRARASPRSSTRASASSSTGRRRGKKQARK